MLLIHGPTGGINWNYTSTFLRNNYSDFIRAARNQPIPQNAQNIWHNFGAGLSLFLTVQDAIDVYRLLLEK
jgi:hypothetical protein